MPKTRPSGEVMPSTAQALPLGLKAVSMLGFPSPSTYWVAICPFSARLRSSSSEARKRPSPWEMGTVKISPGFVRASQGDLSDTTFVRTSMDWWRPMRLKVRVGQFSSVSTILPKGTSPSFTRA